MSIRRNPFEEIERLFERMSREFDEASKRWESGGDYDEWDTGLESMAIDLVEHDDEFVATADLPGFERDDVRIEVTDQTLTIETESERTVDETDEQYLRHERRHRSMRRSLRLPAEIRKDEASARMKNGVLSITLPKLEAETAHQVDIE
ncbi:hsp20-type chaperone [Haloferax mucosum ATCC BAA-1512]|uniref:Hsp20-type chaperone n=1 Tax=Haloferax mucosum ATCC BAA-1512 TaxID=662479 RepID=M0IFB3_9EURY|nr:Hsp20/alpha crystallin family protein [Haloferax mucosum]ELZ94513.1 hsp20-type chaperone [Haloferax mucosum ATCC BAA-1512]